MCDLDDGDFIYDDGYIDGQQDERYFVLQFLRRLDYADDLGHVFKKIERGEHRAGSPT